VVSILFLILVSVTGGDARTFYVSTGRKARDTNTGRSPWSPWRSIGKVNGVVLGPGDTVLFRGGEKWSGVLAPQGSGATGNPVVFSTYGTGRPHIDANGARETVMLEDVAYFIFQGFKITNEADDFRDRHARGIVLSAAANRAFDSVVVRDNELTDIRGTSLQEKRWLCGAIFMDSKASGYFTNLIIEDNHIHDVTVRGITGNQDITNWENPQTMHQKVIVRNNLIDNIGADGIRMIGCRDLLVEHNTVFRCGKNNQGMETNYIAGCFPQQCKNTTWQYNEVAYTDHSNPPVGDEDSEAFDIDWGCAGTHIFQYNYSHDNVGGFFLFMGKIVDRDKAKVGEFKQAIIRYNVSVNDGIRSPINRIYEIHPFNGKSFKIITYNNTFYNKKEIGIHLKNPTAKYPGMEFYNNIFVAPKGSYGNNSATWDNNLYFGHSCPAMDTNPVSGDPKLVNAGTAAEGMDGANDYRIQKGSAALEAGKIIEKNGGKDFWGNNIPKSEQPSIGAHQWSPPLAVIRKAGTTTPALCQRAVHIKSVYGLDGRKVIPAPDTRAVKLVVTDGGTGPDTKYLFLSRPKADKENQFTEPPANN
jgi:hypothetical protein